jgi:biotin carboxyl carrier protein
VNRRLTGLVLGGPLLLLLLAFLALIMFMSAFASSFGSTGGALADALQASSKTTCKPGGGGGSPGGPIQAIDPSKGSGQFTADQKANAAKIVEQVKVDVPAAKQMQAAVVALATAMQESNLHNINFGDRDSIGLFQQRNPWIQPYPQHPDPRLDQHKTTHLFLTGGQGGQRGLLDIPGWENMPVTAAAQAVQVSAFPLAYAKWEASARALAKAYMGAAPAGPQPTPTATTVDPACPTDPTPSSGPAPVNGWTVPMPKGAWTMTSPFGWRMHPVVHAMKLHTGVDLAAPNGTPVYSVANGTVKAAAPNDGYGNQVVVAHQGVDSAYNHLSVILVKAGQAVKAGQLVGKVGSTGMSTGNHLHFEIRTNGKPIDPVPFMRARGVKLDV